MEFSQQVSQFLDGVADNYVHETTARERDTLSKESLFQRLAEIEKESFETDQRIMQLDNQDRKYAEYPIICNFTASYNQSVLNLPFTHI